jgi:hypothetical protein
VPCPTAARTAIAKPSSARTPAANVRGNRPQPFGERRATRPVTSASKRAM